MDYEKELRSLRFSFRPDEAVDYQMLLSIVASLTESGEYDKYKESAYQTLQILTLVYGLEEKLEEIEREVNENEIELTIDDFGYWLALFLRVYWSMEESGNFTISEAAVEEMENALLALQNKVSYVEPTTTKKKVVSVPKKVEAQAPAKMTVKEFVVKHSEEDLSDFNPTYLPEYLRRTGAIPYKCGCCGLEEWQNKPLPLILSRRRADGDCTLDNLVFLCPNCHSLIGK